MARQLLCILALASVLVGVVYSDTCLKEHNAIRKKMGLPPFRFNSKLAQAAKKDQCDGYRGQSLTTRVTNTDYKLKGEAAEIEGEHWGNDLQCRDLVEIVGKKNGKSTIMSNHTEFGCTESVYCRLGCAGSQSWDICNGGDVDGYEFSLDCIYATQV